MEVFLIAAFMYWVAAPDRFTAGARTALGTAGRAAGTGARSHWNAGRDGRKLARTARRDDWNARGGWWRRLLGVEHAAVVTGKTAKGAGKLAVATAKPVPSAIKRGWDRGQEAHRTRVEGKRVPLAVNPPWWHPKPPGEPAPAAEDYAVTDDRTGPGTAWDSPTGQPTAMTVLDGKGAQCSRCLSPVGRSWVECRTCQATLGGPITQDGQYVPKASEPQSGCLYVLDWHDGDDRRRPDFCGNDREVGWVYCSRHMQVARASSIQPDDLEDLRAEYDTDQPTGTDPADITPTEGAPMPAANVPNVELNDLDSTRRFAEYVASLGDDSEFMQIVERCKVFRENLRAGGFGGDIDQAGASFEETAATLSTLATEFFESAQNLTALVDNVRGG